MIHTNTRLRTEAQLPPLVSRGYKARNLDVAVAYGLNAGLAAIRDRMRKRQDCPAWFLAQMDDMMQRSNCLLRPLIEHRDELQPSSNDKGKPVARDEFSG